MRARGSSGYWQRVHSSFSISGELRFNLEEIESQFRHMRPKPLPSSGQSQHLWYCVCVSVAFDSHAHLMLRLYDCTFYLYPHIHTLSFTGGPVEYGGLGFTYSCIFVREEPVYVGMEREGAWASSVRA